ncbi:MAG TPA: GIY-YIG nuclease family protein [Vicingus sp.]|nr:GIY-YIG nuclease family protein [Vicingus sp.]
MSTFYVYILASQRNGTLYIGLTNNIEKRVAEHKNKNYQGFTSKYNVNMLVYFEEHDTYDEAYNRERQMKKWKRIWKLNLIEKENPDWKDLSADWFDSPQERN